MRGIAKCLCAGSVLGCLSGVVVASAQPGDGIHAGLWKFSPFVDLSGVYDSNIGKASQGGQEDNYLNSTLGLRAGRSTYDLDVSGLGFLSQRNYADETGRDFGSAGEVLRLKYGNRDRFVMEVDQSFRRVEENDRYGSEAAVGGTSPDSVLDVSSWALRDIHQVGVSFGKDLTDKTDLDIGYRFDSVNYKQPGLFDLGSQGIQAESSHKLTDKTAALITLNAGEQTSDSMDGAANYYTARVGFKTRGTEKVDFKAGVGTQRHDRPGDADDKISVSYEGAASWMATEKTVLQVGGRNGSQVSVLYSGNVTDYAAFWFGAAYRPTELLTFSVNGVYRVDDYADPVSVNGGLVDRVDRGKTVRARADYMTPRKFLRVYLEAEHEVVDSNASSFESTRASLGVTLQY